MVTIRIYGLAGQGIDVARRIIGDALVLSKLEVSDNVEYSAKFRNSDVNAIVSADDGDDGEFLLAMDGLTSDVIKQIPDGSIVIVNTSDKYSSADAKKRKIKIHSVDATGIAIKTGNKVMPNLVMVGSLTKLYNKLSLKNVKASTDKYIKKSGSIIEEGFRAVK